MSIHSSLSNPDCTAATPAKDESSVNGNDIDPQRDETTNRADNADGRATIEEELLLQTKLKDLRTKKEEMLNLVKELQNMNKDSEQRHQVRFFFQFKVRNSHQSIHIVSRFIVAAQRLRTV